MAEGIDSRRTSDTNTDQGIRAHSFDEQESPFDIKLRTRPSNKSTDSFYDRVTPPDGKSRMREFQDAHGELYTSINASREDISLKSLADPDAVFGVDAGPASCSDRKYACSSDSVRSHHGTLMTQRLPSFGDECPKHEYENIKYICLTCNNALLCQVCLTLNHNECEKKFINDVVNDPSFGFIRKCKTFEEELSMIGQKLKRNKSKIKTNTNLVAYMKQRASFDLQKHRQRLNKQLDALEKEFMDKINEIENDDYQKIRSLNSDVVDLEHEFGAIYDDFNLRKEGGRRSKVYTRIQWSQDAIDQLQEKLTKIESQNDAFQYRYKPSETMDRLFQDGVKIAEAKAVDSKEKNDIVGVSDISVAHSSDSNACKITGVSLLSDEILIAVDSNNSAIKIVDTDNETIKVVHTMASQPLDVDVLPGDSKVSTQVIVTFPKDCMIAFYDGNTCIDKFTKIKDIQTNGNCRSVVHSDGKLIVTFPNQGKIEIITTSGDFLKRISNETIGQSVFRPQFVAIDTSRFRYYISDRECHGILILDSEGVILNVYTSIDMIEPRGVCVNENGAVFACSLSEHQIHHLSDCGEIVSQVNVKTDRQLAPFPHSIVYCNIRNVLYVGQLSYDCIKAYKIAA